MFKKFNPKEDIATATAVKSSIQRAIRTKLLATYPLLSEAAAPLSGAEAAASSSAAAGGDSDDEGRPVQRREKGAGKKEKSEKGGKKGRGGGGKDKEADKEPAAAAEDGADAPADGSSNVTTLLDVLWPKKENITLIKCREHVSIIALNSEPLFVQHFDGPYYPTLRLLHRYPDLMAHVQVDRGAIKFVLGGANIMCPGLTSPTAALPTSNLPKDTPVAVHAYGKEHALAIGRLEMSTDEIRSVNKGVGVEVVLFVGDDLWAHERI